MDPNAMRRDREDETDALLDIREHVEILDRWLKGGGFLTDVWPLAPDEPARH